MNNEIKEILLIIKSCKQDYDKQKDGMHTFDYGELYLLYDYITNLQQKEELLRQEISDVRKAFNGLQQENERLKEELEEETLNKEIAQGHRKQVQDIELQERHELADYRFRCEKAIEMLKEIHKILPGTYNQLLIEITQTLNIIQNGSEKDE